ncbi:DUF6053 domain-containing protein [Lysobacter enzymogenes]|uniref:DUF6053 domain-containing protein n=1 Tax=Lysobacter enzymogenes TaxID=69 RepID=UPI0033940FDC
MGGPSSPMLLSKIPAIGAKSIGPEGPPTRAKLRAGRPADRHFLSSPVAITGAGTSGTAGEGAGAGAVVSGVSGAAVGDCGAVAGAAAAAGLATGRAMRGPKPNEPSPCADTIMRSMLPGTISSKVISRPSALRPSRVISVNAPPVSISLHSTCGPAGPSSR